MGDFFPFFFKANEKEEVGSGKTQTERSGDDLRIGVTTRRGCRGRGLSAVSAGVSGTNHYCQQFGLTNVTNDETQDLNAAGDNNRVH